MSPRRTESELQFLLRLAIAVVLIALFAFVVITAILVPVFTERDLDTTLVLGLGASILGAIPVMLGVTIALSRKEDEEDKNDG